MQELLKQTIKRLNLKPCQAGYKYLKTATGYQCRGGGHKVTFAQLGMKKHPDSRSSGDLDGVPPRKISRSALFGKNDVGKYNTRWWQEESALHSLDSRIKRVVRHNSRLQQHKRRPNTCTHHPPWGLSILILGEDKWVTY
ncbi:hypothetical protein B0H19DRAFT_1073770 [Mycena capillaripes]|nr:hypothetical protein B0H19DRAFT_1073770 [Mycena capillaripes]